MPNNSSNILPNLILAEGMKDEGVEYLPDGFDAFREISLPRLSVMRAATVVITDGIELSHILHKNLVEQEIRQEGLLSLLSEAGFPSLIGPYVTYDFWRQGHQPTADDVAENYRGGIEEIDGINAYGHETALRFTALNAILRLFGDWHEANHLEVRHPNSRIAIGRIPLEIVERKLGNANDPGSPSKLEQYLTLKIPKLAMDPDAAKWYDTWMSKRAADQEADRVAEEAKAKKQAEQRLIDAATNDYDGYQIAAQEGRRSKHSSEEEARRLLESAFEGLDFNDLGEEAA